MSFNDARIIEFYLAAITGLLSLCVIFFTIIGLNINNAIKRLTFDNGKGGGNKSNDIKNWIEDDRQYEKTNKSA